MEVSQCGMGVMSITAYYGDPIPDQDAIELIQKAVEAGCTFFDTAEAYVAQHPVTRELLWNEDVLGKAVATIGRDSVEIGTKFGGRSAMTGPAKGDHMKQACHAALKRLRTDTIDMYYLHRVDPNVPIEETVATMAELVQEGAVQHIGLSEASPEVIRRAHAVHPITCVQQEWSLYTRDLEEDIVAVCRELGIGIVPYSPLGRGFLSDDMVAPADDARQYFPRLTGEAFEANKALRAKVEAMARDKDATPPSLLSPGCGNRASNSASISCRSPARPRSATFGATAARWTCPFPRRSLASCRAPLTASPESGASSST